MANERPPGGDTPPSTTRICVCSDAAALSAVRREFIAAGSTAMTLPELRLDDQRGGDERVLCVLQLDGPADVTDVVDLLLRRVSTAVLAVDPVLATDVFDQGRRVATAEWFDHSRRPLADQLSDEQLGLLLAIRSGDDVEQAARRLHLSARTAARRLTEARRSIGARSTAEAVSVVGRRIDALRGDA